jgi:hypothetical protein
MSVIVFPLPYVITIKYKIPISFVAFQNFRRRSVQIRMSFRLSLYQMVVPYGPTTEILWEDLKASLNYFKILYKVMEYNNIFPMSLLLFIQSLLDPQVAIQN